MAKKKQKSTYQNWLVPGAVVLVLLTGILFLVKIFLSPDSGGRKNQVSTVTLLKPPPPPEPKDKLPEPEAPKEAPKESIITPNDVQQDQSPDQSPDQPAGSDLGVDAEGGSGSDGFGLVGKKGGKALTLGGGGPSGGGPSRMSLMAKYGWYNSKVQDEIKKQVRKRLDQNGGAPKGKFEARVHIVLDHQGTIVKSSITVSSGNDTMDEAIKASLAGLRFSQPPPDGMPSGMTLRLSWQG